jgi:TRAP-type C4-dicarboxylate transport system permease small subunit
VSDTFSARPGDRLGRVLFALSYWLAVAGGVLFCALAALMTVHIVGRTFFGVPVRGYFELVAFGTGAAIFAMLPHCQMRGENIVVDFFLARAPVRLRAACDALGNLLYSLVVSIMVWQTAVGGFDIRRAGQKSTMLEIELWTLFPWAVACLVLLAVVCYYTVLRSVREARACPAPRSAQSASRRCWRCSWCASRSACRWRSSAWSATRC